MVPKSGFKWDMDDMDVTFWIPFSVIKHGEHWSFDWQHDLLVGHGHCVPWGCSHW